MNKEKIVIDLAIEEVSESAYDELLNDFEEWMRLKGYDPNLYNYKDWRITCVAINRDEDY
jgi:uncharacterized protein with PIN domain